MSLYSNVRRRAFSRAADAVGGLPKLARHLRVSAELATDWAAGVHPIPDFVFLKVIDVLLDHFTLNDAQDLTGEKSDSVQLAARSAFTELTRTRDLGKKDGE
jgi:hypothetical protein